MEKKRKATKREEELKERKRETEYYFNFSSNNQFRVQIISRPFHLFGKTPWFSNGKRTKHLNQSALLRAG